MEENIRLVTEVEKPKDKNMDLEFSKAKGTNKGVFLVLKEVYQPRGYITKFNKDGSARKKLKQGRWVKKCVWVPLNKDYRGNNNEHNSGNNTII